MKNIKKIIHDQTLTFDFRKVVFWKETSSLILSDVHVGKITHFRKNGISHAPNYAEKFRRDIWAVAEKNCGDINVGGR